VLVDHLEIPQHLAMKTRVVDDLDVVRVGSSLEQETHELIASRMWWSIFFALADGAHEWRVRTSARGEVHVRVGAAIE
jgi:hypothetical protein